jgi:hypothetical protein
MGPVQPARSAVPWRGTPGNAPHQTGSRSVETGDHWLNRTVTLYQLSARNSNIGLFAAKPEFCQVTAQKGLRVSFRIQRIRNGV